MSDTVTRGTCPHCGTKGVALEHVGVIEVNTPKYGRVQDIWTRCGQCRRGLVLTYSLNLDRKRRELLEIAPPLPATDAPAHTPKNVTSFYRQAMDNVPGNPDAAGSMFRKAIDTALKSRFPDLQGDLFHRIEKARDDRELPPAMAEWAHRIRILGNDAAHNEEPVSKKSATELATFTKLMLLYLFTLP